MRSRTDKTLLCGLRGREYNVNECSQFVRRFYVFPELIKRLNLEAQLDGHNGCVNCLQWSQNGELLASGSDDYQVLLWQPFLQHRPVHVLRTGHTNNIFAVQFMPDTANRTLISGAGDYKIRVHDVEAAKCVCVYGCHASRVKRLAVSPMQPCIFWSAAEDGTVMQFDIREPHSCESLCEHVLINLNAHLGPSAEVKSIAVNPCRPEFIAVGANDPYVRIYDRRMLGLKKVQFTSPSNDRSQWERHTVLNFSVDGEDYDFPTKSVCYYVAGHLPAKHKEFRTRFRHLATTHLTFSPCGKDLLVNLGGEQVYLFSVHSRRKSLLADMRQLLGSPDFHNQLKVSPSVISLLSSRNGSNGYTAASAAGHLRPFSVHSNGVITAAANGFVSMAASKTKEKQTSPSKVCANPRAEDLKEQANQQFLKQQYHLAIALYSQAIQIERNCAVLYANRAAAYLKRNWDGDVYAALHDCYSTIYLDSNHLKANFRLARCLFMLNHFVEARNCLELFRVKFPEHSNTPALASLEQDITAAIYARGFSADETATKRKRGSKSATDPGSEDSSAGEEDDVYSEPGASSSASSTANDEQRTSYSETAPSTSASNRPVTTRRQKGHRQLGPSKQELELRASAVDYDARYCGHCNTTTDIKEANFFGCDGQYIMAGSDDGSFFVWDRETCNIVRILKGDESIVNCLQPHPTQCLLATSGIENVVRLWAPVEERLGSNDRVVTDVDTAARANQQRMNADPLEVMLVNLGYRSPDWYRSVVDPGPNNSDQPSEPQGGGGSIRCTQS